MVDLLTAPLIAYHHYPASGSSGQGVGPRIQIATADGFGVAILAKRSGKGEESCRTSPLSEPRYTLTVDAPLPPFTIDRILRGRWQW